MTVKLYENDSYAFECDATVTSCKKTDEGYLVTLDQTVFFPTGGGQPCDMGVIGSANVSDVYEQEGEIYHLCDLAQNTGKKVHIAIDKTRRVDFMQQHTGEHILSYAFWKLFDAVNVGFHLNESFATFDLDQVLSPQQIREGERFANEIIMQNAPIKVYYSTPAELKQKGVRKISDKSGENPRVVEVVGSDICTCCGTPTAFAGEVGFAKIFKTEKLRGGLRLYFYCGTRALDDYFKKSDLVQDIANHFSCDIDRINSSFELQKEEISSLKRTIREKSDIIIKQRAKELLSDGDKLIVTLEDNLTQNEAKTLLNQLIDVDGITAVVVFSNGERIGYLVSCSDDKKSDCKSICELINCVLCGKGGGKNNFAQGGAVYVKDWQDRGNSIKKTMRNFV